MPREMFGDVTDPTVRVGTKQWYTVPLSILAHTVALFALVVIPLGLIAQPPSYANSWLACRTARPATEEKKRRLIGYPGG